MLGVPEDASDNDIRQAYMALVRLNRKAFVSGDTEATILMTKINSAYEIVRDNDTKRVYLSERAKYRHDPEKESTDSHVEDDCSSEDDILPSAMEAKLADVYARLEEVLEAGFDAEAFVEAHPHFYRSFFGFTFKGAKMVYAFNSAGFVFYTNRGMLLQKLFNIMLLDAAGAGIAVIPEVVCIMCGGIAFSILYWLYRSREAQRRPSPAHLLPRHLPI